MAFLPGAAGTADQALVNVVVASTTASRGQAFRCAVNAESAASESPGEDLVEFGDGGTAYLGITSSRARNSGSHETSPLEGDGFSSGNPT